MNNIYFTVTVSVVGDDPVIAGKLTQAQLDKLTEYFKDLANDNKDDLS